MTLLFRTSRWIARDENGLLHTFMQCPERFQNHWGIPGQRCDSLPSDAFGDITWEGNPRIVDVTIELREQ